MMVAMKVIGIELGSSEDYRLNAAAWRACVSAGIEPPKVLVDYFQGGEPVEQEGRQVEIPSEVVDGNLEVDTSSIPMNVQKLRFVVEPVDAPL